MATVQIKEKIYRPILVTHAGFRPVGSESNVSFQPSKDFESLLQVEKNSQNKAEEKLQEWMAIYWRLVT